MRTLLYALPRNAGEPSESSTEEHRGTLAEADGHKGSEAGAAACTGRKAASSPSSGHRGTLVVHTPQGPATVQLEAQGARPPTKLVQTGRTVRKPVHPAQSSSGLESLHEQMVDRYGAADCTGSTALVPRSASVRGTHLGTRGLRSAFVRSGGRRTMVVLPRRRRGHSTAWRPFGWRGVGLAAALVFGAGPWLLLALLEPAAQSQAVRPTPVAGRGEPSKLAKAVPGQPRLESTRLAAREPAGSGSPAQTALDATAVAEEPGDGDPPDGLIPESLAPSGVSQRRLERRAVEALASGQTELAAKLYRRLSSVATSNHAVAAAASILEQRLRRRRALRGHGQAPTGSLPPVHAPAD